LSPGLKHAPCYGAEKSSCKSTCEHQTLLGAEIFQVFYDEVFFLKLACYLLGEVKFQHKQVARKQ
jgi:hypothetical protein